MRPLLLDLFCGAGGCARGYDLAGFDVVGVDLHPQPYYPYPFVEMDALTFARGLDLSAFAAIHASPPCQFHSQLTHVRGGPGDHVNLIPDTQRVLEQAGRPYVIENVEGAREWLRDPVTLCGAAFGLGAECEDGRWRYLKRHRLFQLGGWSLPILSTPGCQCDGREPIGVYGTGGRQHATMSANGGRNRGYMGSLDECKAAMRIDWMPKDRLAQAIPPAYTQHLGQLLLEQVGYVTPA